MNASHKELGFGLLGMAFTLVAVGLMISGALFLYKNYAVMDADQETVDHTRLVEQAILDFASLNGRYPCPASLTAGLDTATFGVEPAGNCNAGAVASGTYRASGKNGATVRVGTLPVRALNIPDKYMFDGYNHRYFYAVTEDHATAGAADLKNDPGAIYIEDGSGNSVAAVSGEAVFTVISPGESPYGAFDKTGNEVMPCSEATGHTRTNCSFTIGGADAATFVSTMSKSFTGQSGSFTQSLAFRANAVKYDWVTGAWGECLGCHVGVQVRTVSCQDHQGNVVPEGTSDGQAEHPERCGHSDMPVTERDCAVPACEWRISCGDVEYTKDQFTDDVCFTGCSGLGTSTTSTSSSEGSTGFGGFGGGGGGGDEGYSDRDGDGHAETRDGGGMDL